MIIIETKGESDNAKPLAHIIAKAFNAQSGLCQQHRFAINDYSNVCHNGGVSGMSGVEWFDFLIGTLKPASIAINPFLHHQWKCGTNMLLDDAQFVAYYRSALNVPAFVIVITDSAEDTGAVTGAVLKPNGFSLYAPVGNTVIITPDWDGGIQQEYIDLIIKLHTALMERQAWLRQFHYWPLPIGIG